MNASTTTPGPPNPRRVAPGRKNRQLRGPVSAAGIERIRAAIRLHQPWMYSTGPTTAAGRLQAVRNGKQRQRGAWSVRELRAMTADVGTRIAEIARLRKELVPPEVVDKNER